jgi:hypothetical protein
VWTPDNPWTAARDHLVRFGQEVKPDVLFLSGVDWRMIERDERAESAIPIVNLIQHVRHACPGDKLGRDRFLPHKAVRICVSPEITHALEGTGRVRGPMFTVPDAVDLEALAGHVIAGPRDLDLLVLSNKQPELGHAVLGRLGDAGRTHIVDVRTPHAEVLDLMGRAAVTVMVPNPKEGFYLPALEGMALRTVVVCPDCIGNRSFCIDGVNSFRPAHEEEAIVEAAREALARRDELREMLDNAIETAHAHDLPNERRAFLEILDRIEELWATA